MKILVDRLTDTPCSYRFKADAGWWRRGMPAAIRLPGELAEPFRIALRAHRMAEDVFVDGALEADVELECSRCLARYGHSLREAFRLVLEPAGDRSPADPEGAAALARDGLSLGDELESGWFRGNEIDLGPFFLEVITLALPAQPICCDDCPGLCPRCGADLAAGACGCDTAKPDSPFAVLASLRDGAPVEGSEGTGSEGTKGTGGKN